MIELKVIGPVAPEDRLVNTYEVVVNVMSGDADHYEDAVFHGSLDAILPKLNALAAFFDLSWNDGSDDDIIREAIENAATTISPENLWEWYSDFVGPDVTFIDSGILATPDSMEVFWYDHISAKHNVEVIGMKTQRTL